MPLPESVRMSRVAVVAPEPALRDALLAVADAGVVEFDLAESDVDRYVEGATRQGSVAGLVGWIPLKDMDVLSVRLAEMGAVLVPLAAPRGVDPPTLLAERSFAPVVETYGTVPYVDVDPTVLASVAYVLMFGMMFGDVGHGLLVLVIALFMRTGKWRRVWPFVAWAGVAATGFGLLYGEFFGPTGVMPRLWLAPLDDPIGLLAAGVGLGAVLLAGAYVVGTVNRWREGGARLALYASSGVAGAAVFLGLGLMTGGLYLGWGVLAVAGGAVACVGLVLAAIGLHSETGGLVETGVQLFDVLIRLGSNLVSFARLAAFGMTHAALGLLVWQGTTALAELGWLGVGAAVVVFLVGNAITFGLEALVAGIQALRLEFYELFSRVFQTQGRPFRPWHVPLGKEA